MRQQVLDDVAGRSPQRHCDSSYAPNSAQYSVLLQSTEKYYSVLVLLQYLPRCMRFMSGDTEFET